MDTLRRVLAVMVFILIVVVGAGLYYSQVMDHGVGHGAATDQQTDQTKVNQTPVKQNVNVVLQPDLRVYVDEINKGISLINEANGLITADPFFSDPPEVPKGKLETTPFDKLIPKDTKNTDKPILVLPDGTYQIIENTGSDMRDIHRGIYKLGQGMTVLNSVLDKMNQDIRNNNFPVIGATTGNVTNNNQTTNAGMAHGTATTQGAADALGLNLGQGTFSTIIYLFLIGFVVLAIFSVIGFVLSLFKPRTVEEPRPE